jgi:hypothetical protein
MNPTGQNSTIRSDYYQTKSDNTLPSRVRDPNSFDSDELGMFGNIQELRDITPRSKTVEKTVEVMITYEEASGKNQPTRTAATAWR